MCKTEFESHSDMKTKTIADICININAKTLIHTNTNLNNDSLIVAADVGAMLIQN